MAKADVILRTEHLGRTVDEQVLVCDICLEIHKGDILAIVGPSGAGKSSFLRLLNRLDEPTSGTVYIDGQDYRSLPPRTLRQRVGLVMQAPNLFPGTVADNLRFGPEARGETLSQQTIDDLLARVELPGYASRPVENLSGGEAQRVSLARTLANSPEILLLDEPTSALDDAAKREVETLILNVVRQRSLTCLFITHDMAQMRRMVSHVMRMAEGRLVDFRPVEEMADAEPGV